MSTSLGALAAVSRGPIDNDAIARAIAEDCEKRAKERAAEPKRLNLQRLPILQRELDDLNGRLKDQQHRLTPLPRIVYGLEEQVKELRKAQKRLTDAGDIVNVYPQLQQLDKRLGRLEFELAHERRRLDGAEKLAASYTKLISEWHAANGAEYEALCKLDRTIEGALPR